MIKILFTIFTRGYLAITSLFTRKNGRLQLNIGFDFLNYYFILLPLFYSTSTNFLNLVSYIIIKINLFLLLC